MSRWSGLLYLGDMYIYIYRYTDNYMYMYIDMYTYINIYIYGDLTLLETPQSKALILLRLSGSDCSRPPGKLLITPFPTHA